MGPALQTIAGNHHTDGQNNHSETLPYGHLGNTVTSLLRLLFFGCLAKRPYIFLQKKKPRYYGYPFIRPICFGPLVTALTGFYCIAGNAVK